MGGLYALPDPQPLVEDELAAYRRALARATARIAEDDQPEDESPEPPPDAA
jgi:hypothetical protein